MPLVVIVDDQPTNRQIYARIAATIAADVEVMTFADPRDMLAWVNDTVPDLIVTDFQMPGLDGASFIERLRADPRLIDVPVMVITVFEERKFRMRALEAGATDFLLSPVDHREFVTRARNLLKLRRQQLLLADRADLLERRLESSEEKLRDSSVRLAQVIDTVPAVITAVDEEGRLLLINAYGAALFGADPTASIGLPIGDVMPAAVAEQSQAFNRLVVEQNRPVADYEIALTAPDGGARVLLANKSPLRNASGQAVGVLTTALDITERKAAEAHLLRAANYDSLTGLANRTLLRDRVRREIVRSRRGDRRFALHLIDLDGFKGVNDAFGHGAGDQLLRKVAQVLSAAAGESSLVARLGGDEFAVLQPDVDSDMPAMLADSICDVLGRPHRIGAETVHLTASVGTAVHAADGEEEFEGLLRRADLAMYRAKHDGGNRMQLFSPDMQNRVQRSAVLDAQLRSALAERRFVLHYQPQVLCSSGEIVGAEALLRWRDDNGGLQGPGTFLHRAEENGLIVPINEWVLHQACLQAVAWQKAGHRPLRIGVNLSPVQFRRTSVPLLVARVLAETGLAPWQLDLELTESILIENTDATVRQLSDLRELGVRLSIDDFGTGYASLSYLKNFPTDRLKIDQSFVRDLTSDPSDLAIVRSIIGLGHSLGLEIVAEGVETAEQHARLLAEGCDECQGFHFGRPIPAEGFALLLGSGLPLFRAG